MCVCVIECCRTYVPVVWQSAYNLADRVHNVSGTHRAWARVRVQRKFLKVLQPSASECAVTHNGERMRMRIDQRAVAVTREHRDTAFWTRLVAAFTSEVRTSHVSACVVV